MTQGGYNRLTSQIGVLKQEVREATEAQGSKYETRRK